MINDTNLKSEIGLRIGFSSSLKASRDFNTEQKGLSSGISYYHKSGVYADFTSFFDNQSSPASNQSILRLSYLWIPHKKWTINPYAEKTFNNLDIEYDLTQSIGTNVNYDFKVAQVGMDYSLLWGTKTGHRFIGSLNKRIELKNVPLVNKLTLYPTFSAITGTTDIFPYQYSSTQVDNYLLRLQYLTDDEIRALRVSGKITTEQAIRLRITRNLLNAGGGGDRYFFVGVLNTLEEDNIFSLLSYSFSLPLSFNVGSKTSVLLGYSYSIPIKLPDEDLGVDPTGFFSFSLSRIITW
ncbi:MAG: hypothetical protein GY816_01355 [Cytophagales bacterium]|nr:hypothetical protein [Cytophagales bacterium]